MGIALSHIDELALFLPCLSLSRLRALQRKRRERTKAGMNHFFVCTIRFTEERERHFHLELNLNERKVLKGPHERACDFTQVFP